MIKRVLSIVLCLGLFLGADSLVKAAQVNTYTIYVDPNGSDSASGNESDPLASLNGAREHVRKLKNLYGTELTITVIFRAGTYHFNSTVKFDEGDTGTEKGPIIYKAAPGERVEFSGAVDIDISKLKKITDRTILSRLPKNSRDKVCYLDLKETGIDVNLIPQIPSNCNAGDMVSSEASFNDVSFILDGKKQPVSQWPNGRYEYSTFESIAWGANAEGQGGTFSYYDPEPMRWHNAKDMYVRGFFDYDYASKRYGVSSVDSEHKTITLRYGTVSSNQSKRWKALHLLEEIDIPGEWYLDRSSFVLYYYPQFDISNSKMQMSLTTENIISLDSETDGPDYITFEGISFVNTRGGGISGKHNSNNITIRNCNFNCVDGYGIYIRGDIGQSIRMGDYDEWGAYASYTRRGCKDWLIENNSFTNCGSTPLAIHGGGDDLIHEESGNIIRNNYFSQNALDDPTAHCIEIVSGVGTVVENNIIHNQSHHAIDDNGCESKIRYNEINNVLKDSVDSGAIYSGRSIIRRGSEVAYNLIKDTKHQIPDVGQHNRALYFDDEICGQTAHHNICVDGDKSITFGGSSGLIHANVSVDMDTGYSLKPYGGSWITAQSKKYTNWINAVKRGMDATVWNLYNELYPSILREYYYSQAMGDVEFLFNTITDNLSVNSETTELSNDEYTISRGGESHNNVSYDDKSCFIDPDNYDYRVKKSSSVYKNNSELLSEDFDFDKIGLDIIAFGGKERITKEHDFRLLYPQNNSTEIARNKLNFCWQRSIGADKYHFELAEDADFNEKVIDAYTYDNVYIVDELPSNGKRYYWRVNAVNETRFLKGEWSSNSGTQSFITAENDADNLNFIKTYGSEIVKNGGFESVWMDWDNYGVITDADAFTGKYSMYTNTSKYPSQRLSLIPCTDYVFKIYSKGSGNCVAFVDGISRLMRLPLKTGDNWTLNEFAFNSGNNTSVTMHFITTSGVVWLDDASIISVTVIENKPRSSVEGMADVEITGTEFVNDRISASVMASDAIDKYTVLFATYDLEGRLVELNMQQCMNFEYQKNIRCDLTSIDAIKYVKLMVFADNDKINPLCNSVKMIK